MSDRQDVAFVSTRIPMLQQFLHVHRLFLVLCAAWNVTSAAERCSHSKTPRDTPERDCVFPSRHKRPDEMPAYTMCQYDKQADNWWCPTTADYCQDRLYKWCPRTDSTYGGTAPGRPCQFPFSFENKLYTHCTKDGTPGRRSYYWCATLSNFDDRNWTRCDTKSTASFPCYFRPDGFGMDKECRFVRRHWHCRTEGGMLKRCETTATTEAGNDPGRPCHFPFYFRGTRRSRCQKMVTATDAYKWCSTTKNYDAERRWTRCRQQTVFKLEGILLMVVIVSGCLAGVITVICTIHYICDPLRYLVKRHTRRRRRQKRNGDRHGAEEAEESTHNDTNEDQYLDNILETFESRRSTVTPTAPPLAPPQLPPSYEEVLLSTVPSSDMQLSKTDLYHEYSTSVQPTTN